MQLREDPDCATNGDQRHKLRHLSQKEHRRGSMARLTTNKGKEQSTIVSGELSDKPGGGSQYTSEPLHILLKRANCHVKNSRHDLTAHRRTFDLGGKESGRCF